MSTIKARFARAERPSLGLRAFVWWLSLTLVAQPLPLYAQVVVDGSMPGARPALAEAANGAPVIDIATPSTAGVSHNRFTEFNVDSRGLILNNSAVVTQSQLGGAVNANSQLQPGREAQLILNEVTAANRSRLNGYTEITGREAEYILANPYGITCNGCGFINTPRVTLTTGVPQMQGGVLQSLSVDRGDILIEGLGLNALNVDHFNIITRAARLNAEFYANDLELILGRNDVDITSGIVAPKADSAADRPLFALDAGVLGAMYAGRISLIGTEAGVGVRMAGDMAADTGDIFLSADGSLNLAQLQSNRDIRLQSAGDIELNGQVYATGALDLQAGSSLTLHDLTAAQGNIALQAGVVDQQGLLVAGLNTDYSINTAGELNIIADAVSNQGMTFAGNRLTIEADTLTNTDWLRAGDLDLSVGSLVNTGGLIQALDTLSITADNLDNSAGEMAADNAINLQIVAGIDNDDGLIDTGGLIDIGASSLSNVAGTINSAGLGDARIAVSGDIDNTAGSLAINAQNFTLDAGGGLLSRGGSIAHAGAGAFTLGAATIDNAGGLLASNGSLTARFNSLSNTAGGGQSATLLAERLVLNGGDIDNSGGGIYTSGGLDMTADVLTNAGGEVFSVDDAIYDLGSLANSSGLLQSQQSLTLSLASFDTGQANSVINAGTDLVLNIGSGFTNQAGNRLLAQYNLEINANGDIHNRGEISTGADFIFSGNNLTNYSNAILSAGGDFTLDIDGSAINQANARISSAADLDLSANLLENRGLIAAGGNLTAHVNSLDNYNTLFAGNDAALYVTGAFRNLRGANVFAMEDITIAANAALNRSGSILNQSAVIEAFNGDIGLHAGTVTNRREVYNIHATTGAELAGTTAQGQILAGDDIIINASTLLNDVSQIAANGDINLNANVTNRGRAYDTVFDLNHLLALDGIGPATYSYATPPNTTTWMIDPRSPLSNGEFGITNGTAFTADIQQYIGTGQMDPVVDLVFRGIGSVISISTGQATYTVNTILLRVTANGTSFSRVAESRNLANPGDPSTVLNAPFNLDYLRSGGFRVEPISIATLMEFAEPATFWNGSRKPSLIQAGGNLTINGSLNNQDTDAANAAGNLNNPANTTADSANTGFSSRSLATVDAGEAPSPYSYNPGTGLTLPDSGGLFVTNPDPDHPYLVETNPDLLDLGFFNQDDSGTGGNGLLGTDQLLSELSVPPEITTRRLGDAFYETRLMREAVFNVTGQRYADESIQNDFQQMQYLMNNALAAQQELNLSVGVALSTDQVARLTHDILWLIEQEIQGHKVLVPVYYASALRHGDLNGSGALVLAENIDLELDGLENAGRIEARGDLAIESANAVLNSGALTSRRSLSIKAGAGLANIGGLIQGGRKDSLLLVARNGTLQNDRGLIEGGQVELVAKRNDLVNQGVVHGRSLEAGVQDDIINSGEMKASGSLALTSRDGDIQNKGGEISAAEIVLQADRDIVNDRGVIRGSNVELTAEGGTLRQHEGQLSARQDLDVTVRRDLVLDSDTGTIKAGDDMSLSSTGGAIVVGNKGKEGERYRLSAGGDLELNAAKNLDVYDSEIKAGESLSLSGKDVNLHARRLESGYSDREGRDQSESRHVEHRVTELAAGKDIRISAGDDIVSEAANLKAGNDIALSAKDDIDLQAVHNEDYYFEKHVKKKSFGRKKTTIQEDYTITAQGTELKAGGDVRINVDEDGAALDSGSVTFEASKIKAGGDVLLAADDDIDVYAAKTYESHRNETHKKGALGLKKESKGDIRQAQGLESSTLKATNDLGAVSGNNITVVASDLKAGGDIKLRAHNDVLIGAGEVSEQSESWHEKTGMFDGGDLYSLEEKREGLAQTRVQGSAVQSGGNITIDAGRATVTGSTLAAGDSIEAVTDVGDIEVLAARESTESYSHEKRISVSLGDAAKGLSDIGDAISTDDGRLKIKLADAQYDSVDSKSSSVERAGSELIANNAIRLDSVGDILIEGSNLIADADRDNSGDVGLSAGDNVIIKEAENSLSTVTDETHGSAELSFVVQHQAVEVVNAVQALDKAEDQYKQAREDYRKYEKDLKKLAGDLDTLEQAYAAKEPGVSYEDVLELREILEETRDDEDWYKAGVAAAAANVASKTTALVQQTAAAAQSTGTYGFNAGVQLDIDATTTRSESMQTTSLASNIAGQNIRIQTGTPGAMDGTRTLIQGSHLQANDKIAIDTGELNILASRDTAESNTESEHANISIQQTVYGAAGGPSVSASLDRSREKTAQTTYNNSTLNANEIELSSAGDTNIRGGNVHAGQALTVDVGGDLNVESMQNRSRGSSNSAGISGGFSLSGGDDSSVSSVNAGANSSNGRSQSKETVLSSLTSGGTAEIDVENNTRITGALIATVDGEGKDLGNLNLSTNTLSYTDLSNTNYSSQQSAGISSSVGVNGANPADPAQQNAQDAGGEDNLRLDSTNIQYSNSSHYDKGKTLATMGQGTITVADEGNPDDPERLNRDVTVTDKELFSVDRQEGNIDVTIDHRLLSEEGRKEIKEDFKRSELLGESIADIVTEESVGIQDTFQHIGDVQKDLDVQKLLATQNGGENARILNDLANATPEQKQQAVDAYAQAYADVYGITIDQARVIAVNTFIGGAHYSENGASSSLYINDNAQNNALDYMGTLGHEVAHAQTEQGQTRDRGDLNEDYANLRGEYAADNYDFSFANNGLGTVNTGITNSHVGNRTSDLLANNTSQFVTTAQNNPDKIDYRPLEREETLVLKTLIDQVKNAPYTDEVKTQVIGNAMAEACARTHCAEGVPVSDPNYEILRDLQAAGEKLVEGGQNLLGSGSEGELFEYDLMDSVQDMLRANDEDITRAEGATQAVLGAYGAAAGLVATVATAPACTTVVGCAAPAATAGLTVLSADAALAGMNQLTGEYQSTFGQEVLNNLSLDTYQDPSNPAGDLAVAAGTEVLLGTLGRAAEKAADGTDGLIDSVRSNRNVDEAVSNPQPIVNGAATALDELKQLPSFTGMKQADIAEMLRQNGYTSVPAYSGGTVWTKPLPDGNTAVVRLDPPNPKSPPDFADAVPHAHKEIVSTDKVTNGNYNSKDAIKLDDSCCVTTDHKGAHIPTAEE